MGQVRRFGGPRPHCPLQESLRCDHSRSIDLDTSSIDLDRRPSALLLKRATLRPPARPPSRLGDDDYDDDDDDDDDADIVEKKRLSS